jgi:hypothetical protein
MTEIWTARPAAGFVKLEYTPGGQYPLQGEHTLAMPPGYDPNAPNHNPLAVGFPAVTPLLAGFDVDFGTEANPVDHHLRQLRIDVRSGEHGWNTVEGEGGFISQGPIVEIVVGLRDDSGGDPPDDPFVCWLNISALVVYP